MPFVNVVACRLPPRDTATVCLLSQYVGILKLSVTEGTVFMYHDGRKVWHRFGGMDGHDVP